MAENDSPHLTHGQILALLKAGRDTAARRHVESCVFCRDRHARARDASALVRSALPGPPPAEACPSAEELGNYVAGALEAERADAILGHLVDCARCSAILADSVADPEAPGLDLVPPRPYRAPRRWVSAPSWKYAVAAGVLLAFGASLTLWWSVRRSNEPAALLAQAYTQARPFEYRLQDAGHGPIRQQRGAGSAFERPASLTSAVDAIRRMLDAHPQSGVALALRGRAELLEGDYTSAVDSLTRATEAAPDDVDARADLGVAYALRGESENRKADYGQAMELLLSALRRRPDDQRALFNLALTYEKLWMVDEAIETWDRFLRGNSPAGWRREAEERREAMKKIKAAKKQTGELLRDPGRFLAAYASTESFDPLPWYDIFWTEWLPHASSDPEAARAARLLAAAFTHYREFSLLDTLDGPTGAASDSGFVQLARAIALNRGGHPGEALAPARDAAARLNMAGLHAAAALARVEFIYAARWAGLYRECRETTGIVLASLGPRYPWIEGSARLNYSSCLFRLGEDGRGRAEVEAARARLDGSGLWPMAQRAAQFVTGVDSATGNFGPVWETAPEGLHRYWTTAASDYRAEAFHDFLRIASMGMGWRECAVVFYRGAIRFSRAAGNPQMETANRTRLAELLQEMGDYAGVVRELDAMNGVLNALGAGPDVAVLRWEASLRRIQADLANGTARDPLPALNRLAADGAGSGARQRMDLAQTEGLAYRAGGDSVHAAAAFGRAIDLAEQRAASLGSWALRMPLIESAGPSYRNLTLIQLMQHDSAGALATWRRFRPGAESAQRSIAIAPLPEGIAIWTVDDGRVAVRWANVPADELDRAGKEFLRLCASPASAESEIRRVGNRLYAALLRPELRRLGPGTILLTTKSWLEEIPFGALSDDQGEYLGRRFHFVQAYGPPRQTPDGAITPASAALIVAAPIAIAPGQPPLPVLSAAEREAAGVAARFPHATISNEATIEWLAQNAPRAEVFHFSGHGWANGGNGALILPPGPNREPRFVTSANLAGQDWSRCQLAVLSACLTAAGETRGAVNNQSLVQALLSAGARRVAAARWSIDSEATRTLMDVFYARLASGQSVPEALYGAEAEVAAASGWSHPYFWAGFDLFGAP